jgi:hypothetical protein
MFIELLRGLHIGFPFLLYRFLRFGSSGSSAIHGSSAALSCGVSAALFLGVWLADLEGVPVLQIPGPYEREGCPEMSDRR